MIYIVGYGLLMFLFLSWCFFKRWHKLNHNPLTSQKLFWMAIFIPFLSFLFFGTFAWSGSTIELTSDGLNNFIKISTLPLGILSLSIPFVAIVASVHKSIQTAAQISSANIQIELAKKKNSIDELFSREKNFIDKCSYIEARVGGIEIRLKDSFNNFNFIISSPHVLFHKIYNTKVISGEVSFEFTGFIFSELLLQISTIESNIELHFECLQEGNGTNGELVRLFSIQRAICRTLDLLSIPVCLVPYFYVRDKTTAFQFFISSEKELKNWLKKYIILSESLLSSINYSGEYSFVNIRKYVFQGGLLFPSFNDGTIINDYIDVDWERVVNAFGPN